MIVFDCETTNINKGHVYTDSNRLVVTGYVIDGVYREHYTDDGPTELSRVFAGHALVGFNLKFDIGWLRRTFGIFNLVQVWDCQLAEFIYSGQTIPYPSLNQCLERYGLPQKLDKVKTEYWDKGVGTENVPREILSEYLLQDVRLTEALYQAQKDHPKAKLVKQMGWDLLATQEMEWNGMRYDLAGSLEAADGLGSRIAGLEGSLDDELGARINWGSPKQVAAVLFGGEVDEEYRQEYEFFYKDPKLGSKTKSRNAIRKVAFPKLTKSLKDTPGGEPSVDAEVLSKLPKKGKVGRIVKLLLERAAIAKLEGTYYRGIPAKYDEMGWTDGIIHGSINHCTAVTGRTSSEKPNLQNIPKEGKQFFTSRF